MTVEELMQPRYKVIADYPDSIDQIGTIYAKDNQQEVFDFSLTDKEFVDHFGKYPHLFKKLEWWEERNAEDMPGYVKWRNKHVHKVIRYARSTINLHAVFTNAGKLRSKPVKFLQPATQEEYNAYQNHSK